MFPVFKDSCGQIGPTQTMPILILILMTIAKPFLLCKVPRIRTWASLGSIILSIEVCGNENKKTITLLLTQFLQNSELQNMLSCHNYKLYFPLFFSIISPLLSIFCSYCVKVFIVPVLLLLTSIYFIFFFTNKKN